MNNASNNFNDEMDNHANNHNNSGFKEHWDLTTDHSTHLLAPDGLQASHSVLDSLKKRRGVETAQWLNRLAGEISLDQKSSGLNQTNPNAVIATGQPGQPSMQQSVLEWLEKMFDNFEKFANRFNEKAAGTDLIVNYSRPVSTDKQENQNYLYGDENNKATSIDSLYEGHLATRYWAMLFRGSLGKIEVFVVPAEMLLAISTHATDESAYSPLLTIDADWQNGQLNWHIAQTVISIDQVSSLAKELFGDLVRVASGQMSESELFAHPMQELNLGENLAIGYQSSSSQPAQSAIPVMPTAISQSANNSGLAKEEPTGDQQMANAASISLKSLKVSEELLISIDEDINQLLELGKSALQSEITDQFKQIKTLTTEMEAYKETVLNTLAKLQQSIGQTEKTNLTAK